MKDAQEERSQPATATRRPWSSSGAFYVKKDVVFRTKLMSWIHCCAFTWMPATWRLLKAWSVHEIPSRALPLSEDALHTMVGRAVFRKQHRFALSLLVGYYGVLRTGEILGLTAISRLPSSRFEDRQWCPSVLPKEDNDKAQPRASVASKLSLQSQFAMRRPAGVKCLMTL